MWATARASAWGSLVCCLGLFWLGATFPTTAGAEEVSLELHPWTTPIATRIRVDAAAGRCERVSFRVTQLTVVERRSGVCSREVLEGGRQVPIPPLEEPGAVVAEGDRVRVDLVREGVARHWTGLRQHLRPAAEAWVERLLTASEGWPKAVVAPAYLRAEAISEKRLQRIRGRGQLTLRDLEDLPTEIRSAARRATADPGTFLPVLPSIASCVRGLAQHGVELLVTDGGFGWTLTSFYREPAEEAAVKERR